MLRNAQKDLWIGANEQRQWGVGRPRNFLLVLAMYGGSLGGGMYLVATLLKPEPYLAAAWIGWALVAGLKTFAHIFFLGRPERFWRALMRPNSSWISRGVWLFAIFSLFGLLSLLGESGTIAGLSRETALGRVVFALSLVFCVGTFSYPAFQMGRTAFALWRNNMVILLFPALAVLGGAAGVGFVADITANKAVPTETVGVLGAWAGVATALVWIVLFGTASQDALAKPGVRNIALNKNFAIPFYVGLIVIGLSLPVVVLLLNAYVVEIPTGLLLIADAGDIFLGAWLSRYVLFKGGVYNPLLNVQQFAQRPARAGVR